MRRFAILMGMGLGLGLAATATSVFAQDIRGVSFRATEAMPPGTDRGSADILAVDGEYEIRADFSRVADSLALDEFPDATAWVVWALRSDGEEVNAGALNADLVLEGARVDFAPAGLIMSAESSASAETRSGEALFRVTIRTVPSSDGTATVAPTDVPEPTEEPADDAADSDDDKPSNLPTTGAPVRDLLLVAAVGFFLLLGGWRLRRVRL